jgi:hypothetical protein
VAMTDTRDGWCLPSKMRMETTKHGAQHPARVQHQRCSHSQDGQLKVYDLAHLAFLYRNRAVYQSRQHTQTETRRCQGRGPAVPAGMVTSLLLVRGFVVAALEVKFFLMIFWTERSLVIHATTHLQRVGRP